MLLQFCYFFVLNGILEIEIIVVAVLLHYLNDFYCAICADDETLRSCKPDFTTEEPLSATNIAEKLCNEFVVTDVDIDDTVVEEYI